MDVGLEQDIGMPDDSYVLKYFDFLGEYLSVGPPVYFVVKEGYNYPLIKEQNIICSSYGCNDDSVLTQIFVASLLPSDSKIATGASSWLDSYFSWISDTGSGSVEIACCRLDQTGTFINSSLEYDPTAASTCLTAENFYNGTPRPVPDYFMEYLPEFLIDNPHGRYCPQAGHPAFGTAVVVEEDANTSEPISVGANYYMAYHTILKVSADFSGALERTYNLTDQLTEYIREHSSTPDVQIFPYSIFYVYYEQYLTMGATAAKSLGVSFIAVFLVMLIITGLDIRSSLINLSIIIMITVDIMGLMIPWNIQLNAVSLVNLVMAVGISVEFCSHITHTFSLLNTGTKVDRAAKALTYTGSSVLSGITLTKFAGIIVLAFANSQVITVYYFRMYLLIVLLGAAHGLIFLPVLLSLIGPSSNPYVNNAFDKQEKDTKKEKEIKSQPAEITEYDQPAVNIENEQTYF